MQNPQKVSMFQMKKIYKKNYSTQPSEIYPRCARMVWYFKINEYQQVKEGK